MKSTEESRLTVVIFLEEDEVRLEWDNRGEVRGETGRVLELSAAAPV